MNFPITNFSLLVSQQIPHPPASFSFWPSFFLMCLLIPPHPHIHKSLELIISIHLRNIHQKFADLPKLAFSGKNRSMTEHCSSLKPGKKIYCIIPGLKGGNKPSIQQHQNNLSHFACFKIRIKGICEYILASVIQSTGFWNQVLCRFSVFKIQALEMHEINTIAPKGNIYHFPLQMEGFACLGLHSEEWVVCPSEVLHDRGHNSALRNK